MTPELTADWWRKNLVEEAKTASGKTFLRNLDAWEEACRELDRASDPASIRRIAKGAERVLRNLERNGATLFAEMKKAGDAAKDASARKKAETRRKSREGDFDDLVKAAWKSIPPEEITDWDDVATERAKLQRQEDDADLDDDRIVDPEDQRAHVRKMLDAMKRRTFRFGVAMPSKRPADLRILFHATRGGRQLQGMAREQAGGAGKGTFGDACLESMVGQLEGCEGYDAGSPRTLLLRIEGAPLPGLKRALLAALRGMGVGSIDRVRLVTPQMDDIEHPLEAGWVAQRNRFNLIVDAAATRHPELAPQFRQLWAEAWEAAEEEERFDLAIAILRDRIQPLLKSAARLDAAHPGETPDLASVTPRDDPEGGGDEDRADGRGDDGRGRDERGDDGRGAGRAPAVAPEVRAAARRANLGAGLAQMMRKALAGLANLAPGRRREPRLIDFEEFEDAPPPAPGRDGDGPRGAPPVDPEAFDALQAWSTNMASLQRIADTLPPNHPSRPALARRQLAYLLKFANIPNARATLQQTSPIQVAGDIGQYHREGGTILSRKATDAVAARLGVPADNVILVSDPRAMEAMRREHDHLGELTGVETWTDADYDQVLTHAMAAPRFGPGVMIDATSAFQAAAEAGTPLANRAAAIMVHLRQRARANAMKLAGVDAARLAQLGVQPAAPAPQKTPELLAEETRRLEQFRRDEAKALAQLDQVKIVGMATVGDQPAMTLFPYSAAAVPDGPAADFAGHAGDRIRARELMNHHGFTAGPQQLLDALLAMTPDPARVLADLGVPAVPPAAPPTWDDRPAIVDFDADFLQDAAVQGFAGLAFGDGAEGRPPYVTVNVKALMRLLDGLEFGREGEAGVEGHGRSVRDLLQAQGLDELWQTSLNRIKDLMVEATVSSDSMKTFLEKAALIQEEVATLVSVAKPYDLNDFQDGMRAVSGFLPAGLEEGGAKVEFSLKNSASRCFDAVLTALEDVKERTTGATGTARRALSVEVQTGSYYEPSAYVLSHAREHSTGQLSSQGRDAEGNPVGLDRQIAELRRAQAAGERQKLDCYLCEFHHNISVDVADYRPEDVTSQVRKLIDHDLVANPFTVAVDATIGRTDDEAVHHLLAVLADDIAEGRVNVVIYRSAQKFDQLGGDMYNGGIMCVVSAAEGETAATFQRALAAEGEPAQDENLQGLAHLNLAAQEETNDYREAVARNARAIGDPHSGSAAALPPEMIRGPNTRGAAMLQVTPSFDEMSPFLDIKFPFVDLPPEPPERSPEYAAWYEKSERVKALYGRMWTMVRAQATADPEDTLISTRASFGFQHANVTLIGNEKLRLNPGLEDEARLAKISGTLVAANEIMMEEQRAAEAHGGLDPAMLEKLAAGRWMLTMDSIEAQRELTDLEAGPPPDAARLDAAILKLLAALNPVPGSSASPLRTLALLDRLSPAAQAAQGGRIAALRAGARETIDDYRPKSPAETALNAAGTARVLREVEKVEALLPTIPAFPPGSPEQAKLDDLHKWFTAAKKALDPKSEAVLAAARAAQARGDARAVAKAMTWKFPKAWRELRQSQMRELENWLESREQETAAQVDAALDGLRRSVEGAQSKATDYYVAQLRKLEAGGQPGVPPKLMKTRVAPLLRELREALQDRPPANRDAAVA